MTLQLARSPWRRCQLGDRTQSLPLVRPAFRYARHQDLVSQKLSLRQLIPCRTSGRIWTLKGVQAIMEVVDKADVAQGLVTLRIA